MRHYYPTWAEISLDAIARNVEAIRARLPARTKLMCVLKANAYGHGAAALARFLDDKCEYYGVAVLEEALALRAAGVEKPVLILGCTPPERFGEVVEADLTQTISTEQDAKALSRTATAIGKRVRAHFKVDTGMGRIGFPDTPETARLLAELAALPGFVAEGLYSHLACADMADKAPAREQFSRFAAFCAMAEKAGLCAPIRHICNSAGVIQFDTPWDMVRVGIALYGLYPSEEVDKARVPLRPAMSWKTRVSFLKEVPSGTGISYGRTFVTGRPTKVATLPVGYADGYPRALSNVGRVIVRGQYAPIIGRVCMDQCMADVTDVPGVAVGDEVILVGRAEERAVTLEEIGAASASFNYETACRVGPRVARVYTRGDSTR